MAKRPSKTTTDNAPSAAESKHPGRRFLGCGCSTWLWGLVVLLLLTVIGGLLSDGDVPAGQDSDVERGIAVPTFTVTSVVPPTDTPLPTDTPIPPTATAEPTPQPTATPVPILVPTDTPQPAQQPAPILPVVPDASLSDCVCDSNTLNCGDFVDPFDAQACYLRCMQVVGFDVHKLDRDSDSNACEWDR